MEQQMIAVPGPLHPDLFGGETPITVMTPVEQAIHVYTATVAAHKKARFDVTASSEDEAYRIAEAMVERDCDLDFEVECEHVTKDRDATDDEIRDYLDRKQELVS